MGYDKGTLLIPISRWEVAYKSCPYFKNILGKTPTSRNKLQHKIHSNAGLASTCSAIGYLLQEILADKIRQAHPGSFDVLCTLKLLYQ